MSWLYALVALMVFTGGPDGHDTFAMNFRPYGQQPGRIDHYGANNRLARMKSPGLDQESAREIEIREVGNFISFPDRVQALGEVAPVDGRSIFEAEMEPRLDKMTKDVRIALNLNVIEELSCEKAFGFCFDKDMLRRFETFITDPFREPEAVQALEILGLSHLITDERPAQKIGMVFMTFYAKCWKEITEVLQKLLPNAAKQCPPFPRIFFKPFAVDVGTGPDANETPHQFTRAETERLAKVLVDSSNRKFLTALEERNDPMTEMEAREVLAQLDGLNIDDLGITEEGTAPQVVMVLRTLAKLMIEVLLKIDPQQL